MAEKKSTNRADAVELVDMALGDLKKVVKLLNILKECGGFNVRILYEDGGSTGMIYAKK